MSHNLLQSKGNNVHSDVQNKCKHIKIEGESCRLNNNCTYPDCKIETFKTKEK